MQKQLGSILLVAGTCIGSGMIALPLVLAKVGLVPSMGLMIITWAVVYYTSLLNLNLNLQAGKGLSLGDLGHYFSGPIAGTLGVLSLKLLSYALLAVYIYGGSSVLQQLVHQSNLNFSAMASVYALIAILFLCFPLQWLDYINRFLFMGLIGIFAVLMLGLTSLVDWTDLPLWGAHYKDVMSWKTLIPVVFTSFGFQVIFHTLTNYCGGNSALLKRAFFWGSIIPAAVYILWTSNVLSVIYHQNPDFYQQMVLGKSEVGDLIKALSRIAQWPALQLLVWWVSLLAIVTSVIGVGVGLQESLKTMISPWISSSFHQTVVSSILTIMPAYVIALLVPNAFITVLGFAGMILAFIAILLPGYLFFQSKSSTIFYPVLNHRGLLLCSIVFGMVVILCKLFNMIS